MLSQLNAEVESIAEIEVKGSYILFTVLAMGMLVSATQEPIDAAHDANCRSKQFGLQVTVGK